LFLQKIWAAIQFHDIRPSLIWKAFAPKFLRILSPPIGNHDKCTLCNSVYLTASSSRTRRLEWFLLLEGHTHNNWCMNRGQDIKMLQPRAKLRIRNHQLMPFLLRFYITAEWIEENKFINQMRPYRIEFSTWLEGRMQRHNCFGKNSFFRSWSCWSPSRRRCNRI